MKEIPRTRGRAGRLALLKIELVLEQEASERQTERRSHPRSHHGRHGRVDLARQEANGERISRLVDRTAHVERHHSTEDDAQHDRVRALHTQEPMVHAVVQPFDRRSNDVDH